MTLPTFGVGGAVGVKVGFGMGEEVDVGFGIRVSVGIGDRRAVVANGDTVCSPGGSIFAQAVSPSSRAMAVNADTLLDVRCLFMFTSRHEEGLSCDTSVSRKKK
jgi:hypothetical protein